MGAKQACFLQLSNVRVEAAVHKRRPTPAPRAGVFFEPHPMGKGTGFLFPPAPISEPEGRPRRDG